jgi:hypothetical protein
MIVNRSDCCETIRSIMRDVSILVMNSISNERSKKWTLWMLASSETFDFGGIVCT